MRNIWLLGGTGFIGRSLVEKLKEDDSSRINLLIHKQAPGKELEWANSITGSLNSFDLSWLQRFPPQTIYHLARIGGSTPLRRRLAARRGLQGNERLLRFLKAELPLTSLVYVSGSLMYGHLREGMAMEDSPLNPVAFARQYYKAEQPWLEAADDGSLDVRIARPGWILGPTSWFRIFFWEPYLRTGHIPLYGDGRQLMSLIHIDDCANMIKALGERGERGQTQNIIAGPAIHHDQFVELLANHLNAGIRKISLKELAVKYGKAEAEALSASTPLGSHNSGFLHSIGLQYPTPERMIEAVISKLSANSVNPII